MMHMKAGIEIRHCQTPDGQMACLSFDYHLALTRLEPKMSYIYYWSSYCTSKRLSIFDSVFVSS